MFISLLYYTNYRVIYEKRPFKAGVFFTIAIENYPNLNYKITLNPHIITIIIL